MNWFLKSISLPVSKEPKLSPSALVVEAASRRTRLGLAIWVVTIASVFVIWVLIVLNDVLSSRCWSISLEACSSLRGRLNVSMQYDCAASS